MTPRRMPTLLLAIYIGCVGVLFQSVAADTGGTNGEMRTRTFEVNTKAFYAGLEAIGARAIETNETRTVANGSKNVPSSGWVKRAVTNYFAALGVELNAPGKSFSFSDAKGELTVTATASDLDMVEAAVQLLNRLPTRVRIKVQIADQPWERQTNRFSTMGSNDLDSPGAVLTPPQAAVVWRAAGKLNGVKLLPIQEFTTASGGQVQVELPSPDSVFGVTNLYPRTFDLVPYVSADGRAVQLTLILPEHPALLNSPHTRSSGATRSGQLWDGQTFVVNFKSPNVQSNSAPVSTWSFKLNRWVLITATTIDLDGKEIHTDETLPERLTSFPRQDSK